MENKKITLAPFKTYLLGYYAVTGGSFLNKETGEITNLALNRYELQTVSPADPSKWGADKFVGGSVSVIKIPFDRAFAFFGCSPQEFTPEKFLDPLVGMPIVLHTCVNSKGKAAIRGITLDNT